MYELIITEKPSQAKKIADALVDGKTLKEASGKVPFYKISHGKKDIIVACAVGHLYTVAEKEKSFKYPSFDLQWKPTYEVDKKNDYSKKYLDVIKKLAKDATTFTVACDYDIEGEVIGLNIVRFACKQKDARRMKFSTLTKEELEESYAKAQNHLDWGQARAGETRHMLDWIYGVNMSRALIHSVKAAGSFKILSSGRVQGPALKIIVDLEREIKKFVSVPFWQLLLTAEKNSKQIEALHIKDRFDKKKEAEEILKKCQGGKAFVDKIKKAEYFQQAPYPFDLGSLQTEAYKLFGISPKHALQIAQNLYIEGCTSYPRTSSQKLPPDLNYRKILNQLKVQSPYVQSVNFLLARQNLKPNEGEKTDPAHPAIYPTGIVPKKLDEREQKIYDLIVKRFFATFGDNAKRETIKVKINVNAEFFVAQGVRTVIKGWHTLYEPYVKLKESEFPELHEGDELKVLKLEMQEKETQPPRRYTPASIISEMEKRGLGTKATRADIIEALYARGYITGKSIEATEIGIKTTEILDKYIPEILDEQLTRHFEDEMEDIRQGKMKPEQVLDEAKAELTKILAKFKPKQVEIGEQLIKAERQTQNELNTIGKCPDCDGTLMIKRSKFGRFIACSNYPKCNVTYKIPQTGMIKRTDKICELCKSPIIQIQRKRSRPQLLCVNINCISKKNGESTEERKEEKEIDKKIIEKECPKCQAPLVLRKSVYGEFLGCSKFPKCRYTENLSDGPLKEDFKKKKK